MILMLLGYKLKQDFHQNLSKVQVYLKVKLIFSDCFLHQIIQAQIGFQILEVDLEGPATNSISEPFLWLVLNRSRVFVCTATFFMKVSLFSKTVNWNPAKKCISRKLLALIITIIIIIVIAHLLTVDKKRFHIIKRNRTN